MMTGEEVNAYDAFLVFLNGLIVGVHTKPTQLVEKGVSMRLSTSLSSALHLRDYESAPCPDCPRCFSSTSSVRQLRRGGRIGEFVSVYLNPEQKAVYIASDGGRVCRPLLVLELGTH